MAPSSDNGIVDAGFALTAVAVDKDRNSQQAVRWTVDNLLPDNPVIVLIHVRTRHNATNNSFVMAEPGPEVNGEHIEAEITQLFLPYRGFCARKGKQLKEVILDESDIAKAIVDYIIANHVENIVVGASNRNLFARKFRNPDVPTTLMKTTPEFCSVYVISKGKPTTVRTAKNAVPANAIPPKLPPSMMTDKEDSVRSRGSRRGLAQPTPTLEKRSLERNSNFPRARNRDRPLSASRAPSTDASLDDSPRLSISRSSSTRFSFPDEMDFTGSLRYQSIDFGDNFELSSASIESPRKSGYSPVGSRDLEAEMKSLRLELKQTMEMYNAACKEAIMAKRKAQELQKWKVEEARKFQELRQAEEAAIALAEMEKMKCKAALGAAEAAQRIAELEAKKRINAEMKAKMEAEEMRKAMGFDRRYRKYSIDDIEAATNHFSEEMKIGEGGYGPVYRASLDHTRVAIKILRPDAVQGRKQFQQEIEVLSSIRHPNMVLLLGACPEYGCLVYEHMENGSLEDRLFRRGNTPPIPWSVRFKIAAEIATGLLFLHQSKPEPLVHRDLKPANILLDRNYVSKISDVGLARLVPQVADNVTQYRMTSTAGTFCYIDPEYQQTGMLGVKSDIYSLGIMLLQVITAKHPMGITHHVERAIEKGTLEDMLDPAITDWPVEEALTFAKLALKCAELRRKDRPDLGTVVLPELNRLRNLGLEYETSLGYFSPSYQSFSSEYRRAHSSTPQVMSDSNSSAPWTASDS